MRVVASGITRQTSRERPATADKRIAQRRHQRFARRQRSPAAVRARSAPSGMDLRRGGFESLRAFAGATGNHALGAYLTGHAGPRNVVRRHQSVVSFSFELSAFERSYASCSEASSLP